MGPHRRLLMLVGRGPRPPGSPAGPHSTRQHGRWAGQPAGLSDSGGPGWGPVVCECDRVTGDVPAAAAPGLMLGECGAFQPPGRRDGDRPPVVTAVGQKRHTQHLDSHSFRRSLVTWPQEVGGGGWQRPPLWGGAQLCGVGGAGRAPPQSGIIWGESCNLGLDWSGHSQV